MATLSAKKDEQSYAPKGLQAENIWKKSNDYQGPLSGQQLSHRLFVTVTRETDVTW